MKLPSTICGMLAAFAIACIPALASAETIVEATKNLEGAIRKDAATKKTDDQRSSRYEQNVAAAPFLVSQIENAVLRGETSQMDEILNQVTTYSSSEAVLAAVQKLRLALRSEREAKAKAFAAEVETVLNSASAAVQAAKSPADLDKTLHDLGKVQDRRDERASENVRADLDKLRAARQFVVNWQDYLMNIEAGNSQQAIQNLQSASNSSSEAILPRSTVLLRIKEVTEKQAQEPATRVRDIMTKVKSLDDIAGAISAVNTIRLQAGATRNDPQDVVMALSSLLNSLQQTYQSYKTGVPSEMAVNLKKINGAPINGEAESLVLPLRVQLMRLVFPRFLEIEEKPKPEETIQAYLNRMMADASSHLNARLMGRVFELLNRLEGKNDPAPVALQTLLTAQNQDEAEQFVPAVISYEIALKTGGDVIPVKEIGARLAVIKSQHPAEFERGMEKFLATPESALAPRRDTYSDQFGASIRVPGAVPGRP